MSRQLSFIGVFVAAFVFAPFAASAQDRTVVPPQNAAVPLRPTTTVDAAAQPENGVAGFFRNTELSGFVDGYYAFNFNQPAKPCARVGELEIFTCLHAFDVAQKSPRLNMAEFAVEKTPSLANRVGYRVDLDYGSAADIVGAAETGGMTRLNHVQQAYLSYAAPFGGGSLRFDGGKFVTPAGGEVVETRDNWNYSRSLLFTSAIPRYHTGVKATYRPGDTFTASGFVVNGWNSVADNNHGKTVGLSVLARPFPRLTLTETYIVGHETSDDLAGRRQLSDTVVAYTLSAKTSAALNYDFGKDESTLQQWQGVALSVRHQASNRFALAGRLEAVDDRDGFMTGVSQRASEITFTADFTPHRSILVRVEYRDDYAEEPFFLRNTSETVRRQSVLTAGLVFALGSKRP